MASICSIKCLLPLVLLSAIPIAYILSLELSPRFNVVHYHSSGFFRECVKWDPINRRFLVSFFEGGMGELLPVTNDAVLKEVPLMNDAELSGNSSLGFSIDPQRNRVVLVYADVLKNKFSAVAAYDLSTWRRLFLTVLSGASERAYADDVAVDSEGNSYVTDIAGSKIWKVSSQGELLGTITSPLFSPSPQWYNNLLTLNGIVSHPDGFLIAIHTQGGRLYRIDPSKGDVAVVAVSGGSLAFGDGMELVSPSRIAIAWVGGARLVESDDGWTTARVVRRFVGAPHRIPTAVAVKDSQVFVSHMIGMGYPRKKHALVQAMF